MIPRLVSGDWLSPPPPWRDIQCYSPADPAGESDAGLCQKLTVDLADVNS